MAGFNTERLEEALRVLGEVLTDRGLDHELVLIGGGSLLLLDHLERPTEDLDVVARVEGGAYVSAEPLPPQLKEAAAEVGELFALPPGWLNAGPASLLDLGLPEGFETRVSTRSYGSLTVHIAGRADQIAFKLYAATDQGPRSKHFADLKGLSPTSEELLWAARWARTHDPSEAFHDQLIQALEALGIHDAPDL